MDDKVMLFRVGVMVLATLIITAIFLVMFGKWPEYAGGQYNVYVRFDYAGGVTKGTPVRKSGVLVGRVTKVELTDQDSRVMVTTDIYGDKKLYKNEDCYISRDYLMMGDTSLAFVPVPGKPGAGQAIEPGSVLEGRMVEDPTGLKTALQAPINTVENTGRALQEAANALQAAAKKVDGILDKEETSIHSALDNAVESLKAIKEILGDKETQGRLAEAMQKLPDTLNGMNHTFEVANKSLEEFSRPSNKDGRTPVQRMVSTIEMTERTLRKFSEARPGEVAPADQIAAAMSNINEITELMKSVVRRIDSGEGTIGTLMKDRELYNRLNHSVKNIEELTQKMKPILDDARVISDKVARHPGTIIRDAVKPGPGIK